MGTTATVGGKKVFNPSETITLTDVVAYENLVPGQTYELVGTVMNRNTGETFKNGDNVVTSTVRFTPTEANGEVTVTFTFNGSSLKQDDKLVVIERIYLVTTSVNESGSETEITTLIITHENLTDDNQTVTVEEVPKTGDTRTTLGYILVTVSAVTVLAGSTILLRKAKKEE